MNYFKCECGTYAETQFQKPRCYCGKVMKKITEEEYKNVVYKKNKK